MSDPLDLLAQQQQDSEAQARAAEDPDPVPVPANNPSTYVRTQALQFALDKYGPNASDEDVIAAASKFMKFLSE